MAERYGGAGTRKVGTCRNCGRAVSITARGTVCSYCGGGTGRQAHNPASRTEGEGYMGTIEYLRKKYEQRTSRTGNEASPTQSLTYKPTIMDVSGIHAEKNWIAVNMHVFLPVDLWQYDKRQSQVCVCFGHRRMGDWKPAAALDCVGLVGENLLEFSCCLSIDGHILKDENCIPYKYCVTNHSTSFEYLHGARSGVTIVNRCLKVPKENFQIGDIFHQYDSIMFPEGTVKSYEVARAFQAVKGFGWGSSDSSKGMGIPTHDQVQQQCLSLHLRHEKQLLLKCLVDDIRSHAQSILHIFDQMLYPMIHYNSRSHLRPADNVSKAMKEWLLSVMEDLRKKQCTSYLENGKRMASALSIILCFEVLIPERIKMYSFKDDEIAAILFVLTIWPHENLKQCQDYEHVKQVMHCDVVKPLAEQIGSFCTHLHNKARFNRPTWISAIPLLHFLQGVSEPFGNPELDTDKIKWSDASLGLQTLRSHVYSANVKFIETHYSSLKPLLAADPLLLPILVYICPRKQLPLLISQIPVYVSTAWLAHLVVSSPDFNTSVKDISFLTMETLTTLKETDFREVEQVREATLNASMKLLTSLIYKLKDISDDSLIGLQVAVSLALYSANLYSLPRREIVTVAGILSSWVLRRFQEPFQILSQHPASNRMEEIKVWERMLQAECPEDVASQWHKLITDSIIKRVDDVRPAYKVNLFFIIESAHPDMKEIVANAISKRLAELLSEGKLEVVSSILERINKQVSDKRVVITFLCNSIKKQYPEGCKAVSQDRLFQWFLWPICLKIHASFSSHSSKCSIKYPNSDTLSHSKSSSSTQIAQMSDEDVLCMECSFVLAMLEDLFNCVESGQVTMNQLRELTEQKKQLSALCNSVSTEKSLKYLVAETLSRRINQYMSEYEGLTGRIKQLKTLFVKVCTHLKIERSEHFLETLDVNYENIPMKIVFSTDNEKSLARLLDETAPLESMLNGYEYLAHIHVCHMFNRVWQDKVKALPHEGTLSVEEIRTKLWDPVVEKCTELLTTLQKCTMTLAVVDDYFGLYKRAINAAIDDMVKLLDGLNIHQARPEERNKEILKIEKGVNLVQQYWSLRIYANAAKTCLSLKESLKLEGDFKMVQMLAKQDLAAIKNHTLLDMDKTLIRTGEFLKEFVSEDKVQCLSTYCECLEIVTWLQTKTKGVTELQNFVQVALNNATTGEDTLTNAKLSSLRTVGSGFGCLIYELPKDASFAVLKQQCMLLWENMTTTPELPQYLGDCNKEVEWFKLVMAQQGSVKETSFGQLDACINHGKFRVGQRGADIFHNMSDIVKLTVGFKYGRVYTLDGLKDLESKLVLITGSKDERRKTVDGFLDTFHGICEIAEVLMVLQQVGNAKYIGWYITVPCSPELIPELRKLHSLMQRELEEWRRAVRHSREYHYELNYFTTPQLLTLRQALGHSAASSSHSIELQVLALLRSLSPHISIQSVKDAVKREVESAASVKQEYSTREQAIQPVASETLSALRPQGERKKQGKAKSHKTVKPTSKGADVSEDLSPEGVSKRTLLANITKSLGKRYEKLVLQALNDGQTDQIDIENWVLENEDQLDSAGSEGDGAIIEEEEEEEEEDDDDVETDVSSADETLRQKNALPQYQSESSDRFENEVHMTVKEAVDVSHPGVQEVISAGYTIEESILAFETCGTAEDAVEYLVNMKGGGIINKPAVTKGSEDFGVERAPEIYCYHKAEQSYLTLDQLGNVLKILSSSHLGVVQQPRTFHSKLLKVGTPNLLVVPPDQVLKTALSLYMEDKSLPLPTFEEILICTPTTTSEEVDLLWRRAVEDPRQYRTFCLVHVENLPYHTSDQALQCLHEATQGKKGYRLVIICSSDKEDSSLIVSKLNHLRVPYLPPQDLSRYKEYLDTHFTADSAPVLNGLRSSVRVVSSARAGMGKSLCIRNMADQLSKIQHMSTVTVTVPIHGPKLSVEALIDKLKDYMDNKHCVIHLDIAPTVMWQLDTTLFSMMIQGGLSDSQGRVWRRHSSQMYAIEVTPTAKEVKLKEKNCRVLAVLEILPTVQCVKPQACLPLLRKDTTSPSLVLMNEALFKSPQYQIVYQYLRRHRQRQNLDVFMYRQNSVEGTIDDCLQIILSYCGVKDPSWAEIGHFVNFLEIQLRLCEKFVFRNQQLVGDVLTGFKNFVVKFMMRMSRDFATSSLKGEIAEENNEAAMIKKSAEDSNLVKYQIDERKQWEQNSHSYLFFNQDGMSLTFVGFMESKAGDLIDANKSVIEHGLMTPQLQAALKDQAVNFEDNYQTWSKQKMVQKIGTVMGLTLVQDPDMSYVLTVDNLLKILAIQMRFRCGIPVVVMGETGCGKTRLIRFMCDLAAQSSGQKNMFILKVHGGTTEADVAKFISCAERHAVENRKYKLDTVVFFDEANTTDAIGLISEIMCDRTMHGKEISKELKFIATCNPYRRHTDEMLKKLESMGPKVFVQEEKTKQQLGTIPLQNLVYQVQDLPPSMRPLVYNFGQLNSSKERQYISQIVSDHVNKHSDLYKCPSGTVAAVAKVLSWSQEHMRMKKDECSFVSLRDVERAMIVFEYFYEKMELFSRLMDSVKTEDKTEPWLQVPVEETKTYLTRSLILALSVCYHARLQERKEFEGGVVRQFIAPLFLPGGVKQFQTEIKKCQEVLLDNMQLGKNIARNAALRENVFMMAICIDLRIPLFLVGKSGSSKSLAKSIVSNSLNGKSSKTELLRSFKEVIMFSYQCSQLSTSESIIKVFDTAKSFQKEDTATFVSVVVLDEVGLAEDSPNLPLNALHPLLEDGTAGSDKHKNEVEEEEDEEDENWMEDEIIKREERVAFIGISNWALDPAKMNRGVMVTRGDPDVKELELSARGICSTREQDPVRDHLEPYFRPLAEAYFAICAKQKRQFFGLRDFYSLIKMLYWMCERSEMRPSGQQLRHAIMRNFGGMQEFNPYLEFERKLPDTILQPEMRMIQESYSHINPDCTPRGLIKASLQTKDTLWHGENRHLLFLTENYAALEMLKHYIHEAQATSTAQEVAHEIMDPEVPSEQELEAWEMDPCVLFGSSFPKDTEYTQVCRNINQIKICMETGRMVVLLNLHNLYESLYGLLNQYYIRFGEERYVDLGLQTHLKCKVHKKFKLLIIAEKDTVYDNFPIPLINRLEKHFVLVSSVLSGKETRLMNTLKTWVKRFAIIPSSTFHERDAFIGYQEDTTAAVVFQAKRQLQRLLKNRDPSSADWTRVQEIGIPPDELLSRSHDSEIPASAVLKLSQYLLLYTASPAALVRLLNTDMASQFNHLCKMYKSQHLSSISDFLHYQLQFSDSNSKLGLLMQVTTHSHLLSYDEVKEVQDSLDFEDGNVTSFLLQDFDTEFHFSSRVEPLFKTSRGNTPCKLIIIQCNMGYIADDLIACARNRVYNMRAKAARESHKNLDRNEEHAEAEDVILGTHVLFIVYLPVQTLHSSLVGFQGDPWISAHIDEIWPSSERKGQDVTYDLAALEKHILDRFIQGKPRIEMEIQQVAHKYWYISANFSSVRKKVRQVELSSKAQQDILSDLVEIDQLCDSLDVVNILLGFLATGGGRADTRLDDYLRKLRMKSKPISKMAEQHCKLEHVLSLWKTLSVGLGKKMMSQGQEPFDIDSRLLQGLNLSSSDDISRLDVCLRSFPTEELERFLGTMCEFVETFLKHNIDEKQDWALSDVMEGFLEQNQLAVPPQLAELPKSILLPHTVALWKYIVDFQKNKQL